MGIHAAKEGVPQVPRVFLTRKVILAHPHQHLTPGVGPLNTNIGGYRVQLEIRENTFDTDIVTINYAEISSSGTPLVLLHGGSNRWQSFNNILSDLAAIWHVYAPDFRGHGKSTWVPGTYRLQDYADDTIAFVQHCLKEPAYVFGHSLGGMVALLVAAQFPDGVRAVAVGDAPLSSQAWQAHRQAHQSRDRMLTWRDLAGGQKPFDEVVEALKDTPTEVPGRVDSVPMREVTGEDASVYTWLATCLQQNDPDMLTALLDRFETTAAGYEMNSVLPSIQCPVLLLQADPTAGGLMTDREVELALPLLDRPRHIRLQGISHILHLHNERKQLVVQALKAFFQSC
jgi:pimeloyl-ACP methyl ester carboxylesterase